MIVVDEVPIGLLINAHMPNHGDLLLGSAKPAALGGGREPPTSSALRV
jgi:hypothetical protein